MVQSSGHQPAVLADKSVLITGGAGFIGAAIVEQLLARGAKEVVVLDNFVRGRAENLTATRGSNRVRVVTGDLRDIGLLEPLVADVDMIVHLAALRIRHCEAEPDEAFEVMFRGSFQLLQLAVRHEVEKLVAASSSSIYGMADRFPTDEDHHPYNDQTLYGAGKLALEGMLRSFHALHGLPYVALRPFNVYGPRMDIHGAYTEVMIRWMQRIARNEPPLVYGDGAQSFDFTYVDDAARAFVLALECSDVSQGAFNVGTGVSTPLARVAELLLEAMGSDLELAYVEAEAATGVTRRQAATERASEILGFAAGTPIEEGVPRLVDWWRRQPGHADTR